VGIVDCVQGGWRRVKQGCRDGGLHVILDVGTDLRLWNEVIVALWATHGDISDDEWRVVTRNRVDGALIYRVCWELIGSRGHAFTSLHPFLRLNGKTVHQLSSRWGLGADDGLRDVGSVGSTLRWLQQRVG
jgi:hypothetical protein